MCRKYLHHIHTPTPFPCHVLPPTGTPSPAGPVLPSCSLILETSIFHLLINPPLQLVMPFRSQNESVSPLPNISCLTHDKS
jgi:hypothetical protein